MPASTYAEIEEVLVAYGAALDRLCELSFDAQDNPRRMEIMDRIERGIRRARVPQHALINQLGAEATAGELGGSLREALANRLRITKAEAGQRIAHAADLGPRRALTGEPLEPVLPAVAAAEREGLLGSEQVGIVQKFFKKLPEAVDAATRADAEAKLVLVGTGFRPDELAEYARVLKDCLKPDGDFVPDEAEEAERARSRRGITIGRQQADGMSKLSGLISPQFRATLEPVLAKLGAPGMCNPADENPTVDGRAPQEAVQRDARSAEQRNHDGLLAALRALLMSKKLGRHHGLPTCIVITTTLAELEAGAGHGLTAGGTLLPMADVIAQASHAYQYLAVFDKDKTKALYHGKRIASPEQRLVLLSKERGCTCPGCTVKGYWTQVHHLEGWFAKRRTHIDELTLACGPHNRMVELRKYTTCKNAHGHTEWIPPKHLDHGRPYVNCMHHAEKPLKPDGDEPE